MSLIITPRTTLSTFARTTAATFINPNGRIAASGVNGFRENHNPLTGAPLGVLIEVERINTIIGSADVGGAGWTLVNLTPTLDASIAMDGTTERSLLVPTATSAAHNTSRSVVLPAASEQCLSVHVEPAGYENAGFVISSPGMTTVDLRFNMTTGVFNLAGGTATYGAEKVRDGATDEWRIWCSYLTVTGGASTQQLRVGNNAGTFSFVGDTTSGIYAWGMQQEAGDHPSSYIATTTVAVTRAQDDLTLAIADWFNPAEGTLFVECDWAYGSGADPGDRVALQIDDGTNNNRIRIDNSSGKRGTVRVTAGGVLEATMLGATASAARTRIAFAWKSSDFAVSIDGGAVTEVLNGAIPSGLTTARVGGGIAVTDRLGGSIRWWYYPKRLTNSALMEMTT